MINMVILATISTLGLTSLIMMVASFLSKKMNNDREKSSTFECGFDPYKSSRLPFSLRFFLIAIIFLIFDVEITLLLPMAIIFNKTNMTSWISVSVLFLLVLMLGLFHEWNQGALSWAS
uniref:NADH-ubiquinone oxidoreductase chain 3 n=1 Tax=Trigoniophthalmus alternatus TaxID=50637 RepID=B2BSA5_9INSE|nr:NADH dehydrogenase subunit 3 [Trigoniophthalmus alternatus]ABS57558.1 NADH dehydrogenase subunit 3 [Trigoniophthalmus alternatus]